MQLLYIASHEGLTTAHLSDVGELIDVDLEVLSPLPLQHGPETLDGIQLRAVGREEHLLKVLVEYVLDFFGVVDPQVIQDYQCLASLAFIL